MLGIIAAGDQKFGRENVNSINFRLCDQEARRCSLAYGKIVRFPGSRTPPCLALKADYFFTGSSQLFQHSAAGCVVVVARAPLADWSQMYDEFY